MRLIPFLSIIWVLAGIVLAGCASRPLLPPLEPEASIIKQPAVGHIETRGLGQELLRYKQSYTLPSFEVFDRHTGRPYMDPALVIPIAGNDYYIQGVSPAVFPTAKWCYERSTGNLAIAGSCPAPIATSLGWAPNVFGKKATYIVPDKPNFSEELIYNGRNGDEVSLTYRQFSSTDMRDAFRQDLQYDISETDEISYRGARIRVIDATRSEISYEVLEHFTH